MNNIFIYNKPYQTMIQRISGMYQRGTCINVLYLCNGCILSLHWIQFCHKLYVCSSKHHKTIYWIWTGVILPVSGNIALLSHPFIHNNTQNATVCSIEIRNVTVSRPVFFDTIVVVSVLLLHSRAPASQLQPLLSCVTNFSYIPTFKTYMKGRSWHLISN